MDEPDAVPADPAAPQVEAHLPPGVTRGPETVRAFRQVLGNTLVANVTASYLWFALTFWAYLETRSVMATAIIGGGYMLFTAVFGTFFGTLVDRHRKKQVMVISSTITLVAYAASAGLWLLLGEDRLADWGSAWFWLFTARDPGRRRRREPAQHRALDDRDPARPRGRTATRPTAWSGTVQGISFMITSVFSGLSVGLLGMGWTLAIAVALTGVALLHLMPIAVPEVDPEPEEGGPRFDFRGAISAITAVPGLVALILFTTFNNLVSGVYIALMDPYGLTLFSVEAWGIVLGVTALGFVVGGGLVARFGLGANPVRTLLLVNLAIALLGMTFTVREWAWLYVLGIFLFMAVIPAAEAAEQTIMQRVVPFRTQGRVFGFAQSVELAASPISAFLIGPIAEFALIPYMESEEGSDTWRWLLGDGDARGIALVFMIAGAIMFVTVLIALVSAPYRRLSAAYADAPPQQIEGARHRLTRGRVAQAGIRASRKRTVRSIAAMKAGPNACPSSYHSRVASTPAFVMARWVARAHGGGQVSSKRPCTISTGSVMSPKSGRGETPRQNSGSSAGSPWRPRKSAFSSARGASGRWNWAKFSASRLETEAHPTPAAKRPGSAASAFIITPPPIERPKSAIRSGSTRTSSEVRSAWSAATASAA